MAEILAITGAVTTATRLSREMEKVGCLKSRVVHTPAALSSGGCSYSVKIPEECFSALLKASSKRKIKLRGIFREYQKDGEYIYDNIS